VDNLSIQGAHLQTTFAGYNYRIYAFEQPMQPGETRTLSFSTTIAQHGFRNNGDIRSVVDNGTFINDQRVVPRIGMDRSLLLQDRVKRRKYGLPPELRMPKLGTPGADQVNYLRHDADWVTADITVTTDADQIPSRPARRSARASRTGAAPRASSPTRRSWTSSRRNLPGMRQTARPTRRADHRLL